MASILLYIIVQEYAFSESCLQEGA